MRDDCDGERLVSKISRERRFGGGRCARRIDLI